MNHNENEKRIKGALNQGFDSVFLSASEKQEMLKSLHEKIMPQVSPFYNPNTNFLAFYKNKMFVGVTAGMLLVFSSGYGVVAASERSLPGDILYPVKTEIVEEITYNLIPTEEKVSYTVELIDKRIEEIKQVARTDKKIDKEDLNNVEALLIEHSEKLDTAIESILDEKEKLLVVSDNITSFEIYEKISDELITTDAGTTSTELDNKIIEINADIEDYIEEIVETSTDKEYTDLITDIQEEVTATSSVDIQITEEPILDTMEEKVEVETEKSLQVESIIMKIETPLEIEVRKEKRKDNLHDIINYKKQQDILEEYSKIKDLI